MALALGMGFFFIFITMIFVAIAIFLPEWLGITGKKAKQIIADQQSLEAKTDAKSENHSGTAAEKKVEH
jgi:hypothetical protein